MFDENVVNRINQLMDDLLTRCETEIKSSPPEVAERTAHTIMNLYGFKESFKTVGQRQRIEEQFIRAMTRDLNNKNQGEGPNSLP